MPTTRSQDTSDEGAKCHTINFDYDSNEGCDLTVRVNDVCFLIEVEQARFRGAEAIWESYISLLNAVRDKEDKETDAVAYQKRKDLEAVEAELVNSSKTTNRNRDSTLGSSSPASDPRDLPDDADSAVDVAEHNDNDENDAIDQRSDIFHNPLTGLQNWILQPFGEEFQRLAPPVSSPRTLTIHDWYHPKVHCFTLEVDEGVLSPVELEVNLDNLEKFERLRPRMKISKDMLKAKIPWFDARDIKVLSVANYPTPIHPGRVLVDDNEYFFKLVDLEELASVKREIRLLLQAERLGLGRKMHIPKIEAFVRLENSKTEIMGFLMTSIDDPRPLTELVDEEVDEKKRLHWAREADRIRQLLHEKGIIWGDAKADNFLVDKHDKLWIIDFGGSHTDGWVDAELNETEEGDNMGVDKIISALKDPADYICTLDGEEEADLDRESNLKTEVTQPRMKRRRSGSEHARNAEQEIKKQKS